MGMGHGSVPVIFIKDDDIRKLNLISYELFIAMTKKLDFEDRHEILDVLEYGNVGAYEFLGHSVETLNKYVKIYEDFQKEFKKHTGVGIFIQYHDSEGIGSANDDVDGIFYHLDYTDVYEMTPQATALSDELVFETKYYVVYS